VVNTGEEPAEVQVGERDVLFETPAGVGVRGGIASVPPHAGALLGL
jgi:maltooligosyltrehalose trehalohydrolase